RFHGVVATFYGDRVHLQSVHVSMQDKLPFAKKSVILPSQISFPTLQDSGANPESLSFWHVRPCSRLLDKSGLTHDNDHLHWHSLLSKWVWLSVMVLLAAACCLRPMRQGKAVRLIFIGLGAAFCMYILKDMCTAMGLSLKLPFVLAAWIPTLV